MENNIEMKPYYQVILANFWKELLVLALAISAVFFFVSTLLPVEYEADASILITQSNATGLDAYKEVKSAEFAGKIISQIALSNSFMEGVMAQNNKANAYLLEEKSQEDRIEKWKDMVDIAQTANSGILSIAVYSPNKEDSKLILTDIVDILQNKTGDYFANDQLAIKVVNKPFYYDNPTFPNLPLNAASGFAFAFLLEIIAMAFWGKGFLRMLSRMSHKR